MNTRSQKTGEGEREVRSFAFPSPASSDVLFGVNFGFTRLSQGNLALHVGDDASSVLSRRSQLALQAGIDGFAFMNQVHSARVQWAKDFQECAPRVRPSLKELRDADDVDGLLTDTPLAGLAVLTADCLPVLLAAAIAEEGGSFRVVAVGAVHAGREGVLKKILPAAVDRMSERFPTALIQAVLGPSICGSCYEVPEQMAQTSEQTEPGISCVTSWGTPGLDLKEAARRQLEARGVKVFLDPTCTFEDADYSSHRRDPSSGRIAGLIVMPGGHS